MASYHQLALVTLVILGSALSVHSHSQCHTLSTFNAGLLPRIPQYTERRKIIPFELARNNADVYCLQEYWRECDVERLLQRLKWKYPYHHSAIHHGVGQLREEPTFRQRLLHNFKGKAPCSGDDVTYFNEVVAACAQEKGCLAIFDQSPELGTVCIASNCADELKADNITADCISCIILFGGASIPDSIAECSPKLFACNRRLNAPGLVLLSKKPIRNARYQSYFPERKMSVQRGYLEADIDGIGKVVCTHLSAVFPATFEYDSAYSTYGDQQEAEINNLLETFGNVDHILLGDVNTGPEVTGSDDPEKNLVEESPGRYDILISDGYKTPYFDTNGKCTYCEANSYTSTQNLLIDQVFIRGEHVIATNAKRVLDSITPFPLSDHFGVQVDVSNAV